MRLLAGLVPVLGALAAATPVVERGANTTGGGYGGGGGGGPSCLTDDDAQRIANDWLAIFSGSPGRINTTLSARRDRVRLADQQRQPERDCDQPRRLLRLRHAVHVPAGRRH